MGHDPVVMNVRRLASASSAVMIMLLLTGSSVSFAAPSSQPLSLSVGGAVSNLGDQTYNVHGTQLVSGLVDGFWLSPASTTIDYSLSAQVNGMKTDGNAHIQLQSTIPGSPTTGSMGWTSSNGGTFTPQPPKSQGCNKPDGNGQMQCQAQFSPGSNGAAVVTAQYPGDSYNLGSGDSFTVFVGDVSTSPATSTSLTCDQARLQVGQSTSCRATVTDADSSAENAGVTWTSSNGGTFTPQPPKSQGCNKPDGNGQMQCQAQFTADTVGPVAITVTYSPADKVHAASSDSYTVFVGIFGPSQATATSLTCDQSRVKANHNANCRATVLTSYAGTGLTLDVKVDINSQVGTGVPLGCDVPGSTVPCNSYLPSFFVGGAKIQTNVGDGHAPPTPDAKASAQPQMMLESPYLNPWGSPIMMMSTDGSIMLSSTYRTGTIDWHGTQSSGVMTGTLGAGASPVGGNFGVTTKEHEDLVAGTASDSGTMTFSQFVSSLTNVPLTISGSYQGSSVIPKDPSSQACLQEEAIFGLPCVSDCTPMLFEGLGMPSIPPGFEGTCTTTGFQSSGQFHLQQDRISVVGAYSTTWSSPALGFASGVSAKVSPH